MIDTVGIALRHDTQAGAIGWKSSSQEDVSLSKLFINLPSQRALLGEEAGIRNWANVVWLKPDAERPRGGFQGRSARVLTNESALRSLNNVGC